MNNTTQMDKTSGNLALRQDKIIAMCLIFSFTLVSQFLPYILRWSNKKISQFTASWVAVTLDLLLSLSTGVILGAAFCHVLPDAQAAFSAYFSFFATVPGLPHNGIDYPFANFIMTVVFFALISVNEIWSKQPLSNPNETPMIKSEHAHANLVDTLFEARHSHEPCCENKCLCPDPAVQTSACDNKTNQDCMKSTCKNGGAYIFFLSLSLHSFIEGLSIGSEQSLNGSFWSLFVAIVGHKVMDGLALGIPFSHSAIPLPHVVICFVVSAATGPSGIATGMIITTDISLSTANTSLAVAILLSMACGSFLYISFIEMVPALLMERRLTKTKLGLLFVGFGIMAVIAIYV